MKVTRTPIWMKLLIGLLVTCALAGCGHCESSSVSWCYHHPSCGPATWHTDPVSNHCNGSRQSPININTSMAIEDSTLVPFSFKNYDSKSALTSIKNTGRTVEVTLKDTTVSGAALPTTYQSLQFHLHWGNRSTVPGSEHTVNGKRYPMEMHIVSIKEIYNGNVTLALQHAESAAALSFLLEEMDGPATNASASWDKLASYLENITHSGDEVSITDKISLDDLLGGVDRTKYYRYLGSLTTPSCNEIVTWSVFKDSIKIRKETIDLFSNTVRIGNGTSALMVNTYRNTQPGLRVTTTVSGSSIMLASAQLVIAALWALMGV